jgi:hypothetical protein
LGLPLLSAGLGAKLGPKVLLVFGVRKFGIKYAVGSSGAGFVVLPTYSMKLLRMLALGAALLSAGSAAAQTKVKTKTKTETGTEVKSKGEVPAVTLDGIP